MLKISMGELKSRKLSDEKVVRGIQIHLDPSNRSDGDGIPRTASPGETLFKIACYIDPRFAYLSDQEKSPCQPAPTD